MASRALVFLVPLVLPFGCSTEAGAHPDDSHERVITDWAAAFAKISPVIAEVTDHASWDRARPRLEAILDELSGISQRSKAISEPDPERARSLDALVQEQVAEPMAALSAARAALPEDIDQLFVREVLSRVTPPGAPDARTGPFIYTIF